MDEIYEIIDFLMFRLKSTLLKLKSNGFFSRSYISNKGITIVFLCSAIFSEFKNEKRLIIYLLYMSGKLEKSNIENCIHDEEYIKDILFDIAFNEGFFMKKAQLRDIVNILDKKTFNKKFNDFFVDNKIENKRLFNFSEVYNFFQYVAGDDWSRLEVITKKELTKNYGIHEEIERMLTDDFDKISLKEYKTSHSLLSKDIKGLLDFYTDGQENPLSHMFSFYIEYLLNRSIKDNKPNWF